MNDHARTLLVSSSLLVLNREVAIKTIKQLKFHHLTIRIRIGLYVFTVYTSVV